MGTFTTCSLFPPLLAFHEKYVWLMRLTNLSILSVPYRPYSGTFEQPPCSEGEGHIFWSLFGVRDIWCWSKGFSVNILRVWLARQGSHKLHPRIQAFILKWVHRTLACTQYRIVVAQLHTEKFFQMGSLMS